MSTKTHHGRRGFQKLKTWMQSLMLDHSCDNVVLGVEPTGHYWMNLAQLSGALVEKVRYSKWYGENRSIRKGRERNVSSVEYRVNARVTGKEVADVFVRSGINRPTDDVERIQKMLDHGNLIITAWDGEKLVGIARSLTDFCYCRYLSDLAVDQEYHRGGVGKELIRQTKMQLSEQVSLLLLSAPTAMTYYPKVGFDKAENAWIIRRKL